MFQDVHRRWIRGVLELLQRDSKTSSKSPAALLLQDEDIPFQLRERLLNETEGEVFHALVDALGDVAVICPKIRITDVLCVVNGAQDFNQAARIDRKVVDFLVCDRASFEPLMAIQIDRWIQSKKQYELRDAYLERALVAGKLRLVHVPSDQIPSSEWLRGKFDSTLDCPQPQASLPSMQVESAPDSMCSPR